MKIRALSAAILPGALTLAAPALALQPLESFVKSARVKNPDNNESKAQLLQQEGQQGLTLARILPGLTAKGTAVHNQYNAVVDFTLAPGEPPRKLVIQPYNQLLGNIGLTVPLVDLASFVRLSSQGAATEAASLRMRGVQLATESSVAQSYYQLVANVALKEASVRALDVARANLELTQQRFQVGQAASLDVDRANAEVERQVQQLALAELQLAIGVRSLQSLTGMAPDMAGVPKLQDDLAAAPPLEKFSPPDTELPNLAAAMKAQEASRKALTASKLAFLPTLNLIASEQLTNATGFTGRWNAYAVGFGLSWQLDYSLFANVKLAGGGLAAARAQEDRARLASRDAIYRSWHTVSANIARARSARVQATTSTRAAELAQDRYQVGAATQLDLLQAQRDAFSAQVAEIQAAADLANSRAQLQLAAGQELFPGQAR